MENKAKTIVFLVFTLFFAVSLAHAQTKTLKNIGFIQDNIWFSKDPFFEGDKVRIYTAVLNSSQYDFKGTLEFYAGGKSLGKSDFSLVSGGFQVLWADWVAEVGSKKIFASISGAKISLPGGVEEAVVLENVKTGEKETFVDKDSDGDGVGDKNDPKDDRIKEKPKEEAKPEVRPIEPNASGANTQASTGGGSSTSFVPSSKETASAIQGVVSNLNTFLDQQKEKAENKKDELQKKLGEGESLFEFEFLGKQKNSAEDKIPKENKDLFRIYLLALSALIFSLEYKVIIYLLGIYIAYRVLKFFLKKLFWGRGVDKL